MKIDFEAIFQYTYALFDYELYVGTTNMYLAM